MNSILFIDIYILIEINNLTFSLFNFRNVYTKIPCVRQSNDEKNKTIVNSDKTKNNKLYKP